MSRFIVTGGRDYTDGARVRAVLSRIPRDYTLVHGSARGADALCARQWEAWGGKTEPHPADWGRHGKWAGPIRNQEMLDSGADFLVAFPGGKGTADMTRRAARAGLKIWPAEVLQYRASSVLSPRILHG